MVQKDRFLVVVSVLEGKKFPKRPRHKLIAEARFDGELLATDPVEHVESPDFTQELAWELDKKGLHQHRLQRTSIKVQVYAQDTQSTMREAVGYVVMDLRSAGNQQSSKWHHLLHSKYQKSKPEIRLGMYIDDDKGGEQASFRARDAPARPGQFQDGGDIEFDPKLLKPVLNDAEGFYQIGPGERCKESFVLSVTVAFAANLPQLVPTNIPLPATGYFFYYSLLGNDVTNEVFHDLLNPSFPPERASVRLRSSTDALRQFFSSQPGVEIHLCCGDQSLGSCEVPLGTLLKQGSTEIYMKPVTMEGAFQLNPPNRLKPQLVPLAEDMKPVVGVSIVLRKEDQGASGSPGKSSPDKAEQAAQQPRPSSPKAVLSKEPSPKTKQPPKAKGEKKPKKKLTPPPSPPTPHEGSYTETFESNSRTGSRLSSIRDEMLKATDGDPTAAAGTGEKPSNKKPEETEKKLDQAAVHTEADVNYRQLAPPPPPSQGPVLTLDQKQAESSSSTQHHVAIPPQLHHFGFSVDLRSINHLDVAHSANIFLRYTYPFFGSAAPILTQPPTEVRRGSEVLLPQAFCAFNFATNSAQLQETFNSVPLVVEVWDRDKQKSQNNLLGAAQLPLSLVFASEKSRAVHTNGSTGWRQVWSDIVPVVQADGPAMQIGELLVVLTLEDWGPLNTQVVLANQDTLSQGYSVSEQSHPGLGPGQRVKPSPPQPQEPQEPRKTQEYKAALELEMWKEQQEALFESQLKEKEMQHMRALAEEWKRRDKERELLMKKKLAEYQHLEEQLRKTIADLDKRDRKLSGSEQEVTRLRQDLEREHERKMTEMREASRRLKEDCDHQVQLEKNKIKDLEEYVAKLKSQLLEAESRCHQLDRDFIAYKEQQNSKPEVRLQSEINLLTLEKVELERKLDAVTKSKVHYKQQWGRALKELARLKQKEQAAARAQLRRQQQELEHMRLRYLAAEEKEVVKAEKQELQEIKNELNQLREHEMARMTQQSQSPGQSPQGSRGLQSDFEATEEEHITRLIEERDTLLRTGVYTSEDCIISELDRQIREAIAKKGR